MKSLYESCTVDEVKHRLASLTPDTQRLWGKMTAAQMLRHCAISMESAIGDRRPPRLFIGRVLSPLIKPMFSNDKPLSKNGPTAPWLIVNDDRELTAERARLVDLIDHFSTAGPTACTKTPHAFFGKLTPEEWGKGMYKHLDHHLQQFGA